ncbi:MAG: hypothetical protein ICV54_22725 [Nostoc sp. C3-bin3]|nr:hypothetical protein [Nostoc sp. C3-bin3]
MSTCRAFRFLDFVADFLRSAWVSARDWWHPSTPFFGYQGKQLTFAQAQVLADFQSEMGQRD